MIKVALDPKNLIGAKTSSVEAHAGHAILGIAPIDELLIKLVCLELQVELAVGSVLVDLHQAIKGHRILELGGNCGLLLWRWGLGCRAAFGLLFSRRLVLGIGRNCKHRKGSKN